MHVNSNISEVFAGIAQRVATLSEPMLREIAVSMLPVVKERIHVQGKATDNSQIGTYSEGYMTLRTGAYQNADKKTKGKEKGKLKNSGTYTDRVIYLNKKTGIFHGEDKVGKSREQYHRTADTKVILSLTRQMESDFSVQATEKGYGLGYNNSLNYDKSQWAESTYKKKIFSLSDSEKELVIEIANTFTNNTLNG